MGERSINLEEMRNLAVRKVGVDNLFRKKMGLSLIKTGDVSCLRCGQFFFSDNIAKKRLCDTCADSNQKKSLDGDCIYR